jgi:elongator complex protein 3
MVELEIIKDLIKTKPKNQIELSDFKREISKKYKIKILRNFEILGLYQKFLKEKKIKRSEEIEKILKIKPVRSLSGIVNVSVLTKPYACGGRCIFCPTEFGMPKSYLSGEPAADRAKFFQFDPYLQTKRRIEMLKLEGHPTDKIELRIIGGSFTFYPKEYQTWFIKECFRGANDKVDKLNKIGEKNNLYYLLNELKKEQKRNEKAKNKIVGISIETRPNLINEEEIKWLRKLGVTLVEMGVQNVIDEILRINETDLNFEIIAKSTKLLKDSGFKVLYHLMPNLLGSNPDLDFKSFKLVFFNENFKPDWVKIYPTMVLENTKLYKIWKEGKYIPYSNETLIELLIKISTIIPRWIRVTRMIRDIPSNKVIAGVKDLNLRETVEKEVKKRGSFCSCIRCREVKGNYNPNEKIYIFREDYEASGGREIFLSFESKNRKKIFSYLRLRIPSQIFEKRKHFLKILENSAIIREIQTFGELVPIGTQKLAPQHRGLGKKLIKKAEEITKNEFKLKNIAVISGVGVRDYWRKFGYRLKDTYMIKKLF